MKKIIAKLTLLICVIGMAFTFTGCGYKNDYTYGNSAEYAVGAVTLDTANISKLDISWVAGAVEVIVDKNIEKIEIYEECEKELEEDEKLRYKLDADGTLNIKYRQSTNKKVKLTKEKKLVVKVPTEISVANSVDIETISAGVKVEDLKLTELEIETSSGQIIVGGGVVNNVNLETNSGDITIVGEAVLSNIDIENVSGEVSTSNITCENFELESISGTARLNFTNLVKAEIESTSGNVEIQLPNAVSGFSAKFLTKSGRFNSTFATEVKNGANVYGTGGPYIVVETVSANLNVKGV